MKKRVTAFLLVLCLMVGCVSAITPTASAASVTTNDMASLASAAQQAIGSSAADLGLPAGDWCGYFVGNRMNNSQIAAKLGTTPYNVCAYAISLVSWICATKDAGVFYVASPVHQNRLLEIDPRLGNNGRMVARTSSGWSPLPGDILQFSWSNWNLHTFDHTGIVVSVSGDMITYVDGNGPSGRVAAHTIRKDSSTIFGHIRFNTDSVPSSSNAPEYFDCDVMISCVKGQLVNLYNNPGDSVRSDYFDRGQAVRSTYGVKMGDGSTWYQISAASLGVSKTFWLKYESGKMTVEDIQPSQPTPCSHNWDAGVETVSPTLTASGTRTYTCTVCGETKSETVPTNTSISGRCLSDGDVRWTLTNGGMLTVSGAGALQRLIYDLGEKADLVKHVVVEEGITEVTMAFTDCKSIQTIQLPASLSKAHIAAFLGCVSLKEVAVSEQNPGLRSVDGVLFTKNMDTIILYPAGRGGSFRIPDGVKTIAASFDGTKLSTVEIPVSVTDIYEYAFEEGPTMLVHSGSYAERFAQEHGRTYKVIDAPTKPVSDRVQVTLNLGTLKTNHLDRFKAVKTYSDGIFRDVNLSAWYRDNVAAAYELGLMKGTGQGAFEPGKNVTIAETITLAARLHSIYQADGASFECYDGGNWYDPYVNYARSNGLLSENYDYSRPATREEFVHLLAKALPNEALPAIKSAPVFDDAGRIIYSADVELLSQAGVITGNGSCFLPKNPITRAEVAAVVTRMAKAELRKG